jgi:ribosomal protein L11 methyltransferase
MGDASTIKNRCFDIIFANINRNILLSDMVFYADALTTGGNLLISGFYSEDLRIIDAKAGEHGLVHEKKIVLNNWIAARYKKRTE